MVRRFILGILLFVFMSGVQKTWAEVADPAGAFDVKHKESIVNFYSNSLQSQTTATVFTPDPMEPGKRYPVIYILHGYGGNYRSWAEYSSMTLALAGHEVIAVLPEAAAGWYVDSPLKKNAKYESLISKDVIEFMDKNYPTVPRREGRAVMGLSMGGHGAMTLAAKHPDKWCAVSSLSGTLNLFQFPQHGVLSELLGVQPAAKKEWAKNSAVQLVEKFAKAKLCIMFDCGAEDPYVESSRQMHELLWIRGIPHVYREFLGKHTWTYWADHLPEHIVWNCQSMEGALLKTDMYKKRTEVQARGEQIETLCKYEQDTRKRLDASTTKPLTILIGEGFANMDLPTAFPELSVVDRSSVYDQLAPQEGADGDVGFGLIHRLPYSVISLNPAVTVISSDFYSPGKTETALANYREIIKRLLAADSTGHSRVIVVTEFGGVMSDTHQFAFSARMNRELRSMVDGMQNPRVVLADYAKTVLGSDGLPKPEYQAMSPDQKKKALADFLRPYLK